MVNETLRTSGWAGLLERLPAAFDVEASAREAKAFARARGVPDAAALLRLALVYGTTPLSLRGTAAWARLNDVAQVSDVALLYRLQGAEAWLGVLLAATLTAKLPAARGAGGPEGYRLRVRDATMIGSLARADSWRVHATYSLSGQCFTDFRLSDRHEAESLTREDFEAGDIALADRFHAKPAQLHHVAAQGADFIVRRGLTGATLRVPGETGGSEAREKFDIKAAMAAVGHGKTAEWPVLIPPPAGDAASDLPARLIVAHLGDAAETARARLVRKAALKQQPAMPKRIEAAGYLMLVTTLDAQRFPADEVIALYRLRWQVEIAFKRLKSLLGLADLQAKEPRLARCCLYAKLLLAALVEDCLGQVLDSSPSAL